MSLNWNCEKLKDKGELYQKWKTAMVYATMTVGLGKLTPGNLEEWKIRVEICKLLQVEISVDSNGPIYPSDEVLKIFVGMVTNASTVPRATWLRRFIANTEKEAILNVSRRNQVRDMAIIEEIING